MGKGNPNPIQTEEFLAHQKPRYGETALGQPISIRFSLEVDAAIRQISDRQEYIRRAVKTQLKADGLL